MPGSGSMRPQNPDQAIGQKSLFEDEGNGLVNLAQAARWAAEYTHRDISISNISYLIQYGRIKKHGDNGSTLIDRNELKDYYDSTDKEHDWKSRLGDDLNWRLSFAEYREKERTKHVHRLHPYKGKYIPQLVEYFMDAHTDEFKTEVYFNPGDIVLDPFCGSGTTLVQANELGVHAVGTDVSQFNCMIANIKTQKHDPHLLAEAICNLTSRLEDFNSDRNILLFDNELLSMLSSFNADHFPAPDYRRKVALGVIAEAGYASQKESDLLPEYHALVKKYRIKIRQDRDDSFLGKWLLQPIRDEVDFILGEINKINDPQVRKVMSVILSRTARSCRATTHADLGTLKEPVTTTYYCKKHGKICKPIFTISNWWKRYSADTLERLNEFNALRTDTLQSCIQGDSRNIDLINGLHKTSPRLANKVDKDGIKGIFSSPPYVGLIDYHEQHAYAYELFRLGRDDGLEIGPLFNGQGAKARNSYVAGIAKVLQNCKRYLQPGYDVFLVANDKHDLYPDIAKQAGMEIVNRFKRPVLCRVEKDRSNAYSETIFHMKRTHGRQQSGQAL